MPISDCEVRDPRIRRTRRLFQDALRSRMYEKSFDEISVQDITDTATVNRAAFHDHYTDKFALLDAMVAGGFHKLLQERNVRYDGTCPSAASAIILAACDYLSDTYGNCDECKRQTSFEPLIEAAITAAIRRVLMEGVGKASLSSSVRLGMIVPQEMIVTTASWAIYNTVEEWTNTPARLPAEEIVPFILQLVMPILQTAGSVESDRL